MVVRDSTSTSSLSQEPPVPYWRLSSFYFWYFALLGALYPYWSLYFESLGFAPVQIGALMAVMMGTKVIAPNLWAWLADHTGRHVQVMRLGSGLGLLFFCGLLFTQQYGWLLVAIAGYSFFWNAILPQHEAITLGFLHGKPERYSQIRLWGSIGFVVAVVVAGYLFDRWPMTVLPAMGVLLCALIFVSSLTIPVTPISRVRRSEGGFWRSLGRTPVVAFLLAGVLMQVAHGVYYSFFSIHLAALGYDRFSVGVIWGVGVVAEILIFVVMHRLLPRFGVKGLLIGSLILAGIRWLLIGHFADQILWLIVAQTLHAFTFGAFHSASIEAIRRFFGRAHQGKGQAFYGALCFGGGGALGSLIAGEVWEQGASLAFDLAAVVSFVGALIMALWFVLRDDRVVASTTAEDMRGTTPL